MKAACDTSLRPAAHAALCPGPTRAVRGATSHSSPAAHAALHPGPPRAMQGAMSHSSAVLSQVCWMLAVGSHSRGFQWAAPVCFRWVSTRERACQVTAQQMLPDGATKLWLTAPEPASPSSDLSAHLRSSFWGAVTDPRRGSICTSPRMKKLSACSGSPIV